MAQGKGAFYQRLQPSKLDVGKSLLDHENQQFKHRAEERLVQDREDKKAKEAKERKDASIEKLELIDTGDTDLNVAEIRALEDAASRLDALYDRENDWSAEDRALVRNLENFPENFKAMQGQGISLIGMYAEGRKNGTVKKNQTMEVLGDDGSIGFGLNEQGLPFTYMKGVKGEFYGGFKDIAKLPDEFMPVVDRNVLVTNLAKGVGTDTTSKISSYAKGDYIKSKKEAKYEDAFNYAKQNVGQNTLLSLLDDYGLENTPENIDTVYQSLAEDIVRSKGMEQKTTKGHSKKTPRGGGGGDLPSKVKDMHADDNKIVLYEKGEAVGNVKLTEDTVGFTVGLGISKKGKEMDVSSLSDAKEDNYRIDNAYVDRDGKIIVEGTSNNLIKGEDGAYEKADGEKGGYKFEIKDFTFASDTKDPEELKILNQLSAIISGGNVKDLSDELSNLAKDVFEERKNRNYIQNKNRSNPITPVEITPDEQIQEDLNRILNTD